MTELAAAIRERRVSALEVVSACLARIEKLQPSVNAFIRIDVERALRKARAADSRLAHGETMGPLHGVPVAHKDIFHRKGRTTTAGSRLFANHVADHTSTVVERLDAAGAIELGTLNTSDCAINPFGLNVLVGRACNPWDLDRVTGGSSSGSAAAVAARMAFASLGSDSGGSVRLPAAMCGVVGLKPTAGRVSRYGAMPVSFSMDTIGPLTRTVADCAMVFDAIAGPDQRDSTTWSAPAAAVSVDLDQPVEGVRMGVADRYFSDELPADALRAFEACLAVFRGLRLSLHEAPLPDVSAADAGGHVIIVAEAAQAHKRLLATRADEYTPATRRALELGLCVPAALYIDAIRGRSALLREFLATTFAEIDVLATPTLAVPVPAMAEVEADLEHQQRYRALARNTKPFNTYGLPALSLPGGFTADGLPVGVQLVGRPYAEPLLLRVGNAFQKVVEHHGRIPTVLFRALTAEPPRHPAPGRDH